MTSKLESKETTLSILSREDYVETEEAIEDLNLLAEIEDDDKNIEMSLLPNFIAEQISLKKSNLITHASWKFIYNCISSGTTQ